MLDGLRTANSGKYSWDNLSEFQKQNINEGLDDIEHGRRMSSNEFWNQLKMADNILLNKNQSITPS
jgi:G3E family GTPase